MMLMTQKRQYLSKLIYNVRILIKIKLLLH